MANKKYENAELNIFSQKQTIGHLFGGMKRMVNKNYKKLYEELKQEKDFDVRIKFHEKSYIHIPFSWGAIGRFFSFIGSLLLCVGFWFVLKTNWIILNISEIFKPENEINRALINVSMLGIIPNLIFAYLLIGLTAICLVALIKGGFNKVKKYEENGLIAGLIFGLIGGIIAGLIVGLIAGLIFGLIVGLIFGLIVGIIGGIIGGIITGLIGSLNE